MAPSRHYRPFLALALLAMWLCVCSPSTADAAAVDEMAAGILDIASSTYLTDQTLGVVAAMSNTSSLRSIMKLNYIAKIITMAADGGEMANELLAETMVNDSISFLEAGIPASLTNVFVADPINITSSCLPSSSASMLYFFPTLPQEFYVFGNYLAQSKTPANHIRAVLRHSGTGEDAETMAVNAMAQALRTALRVYNLQNTNIVVSDAALDGLLDATGTTILLNLSASDVPTLITFLEAHDEAAVMIGFDDLTKFFTTYQTAFGASYVPAMDRLLFATNLPPWNDNTTATPAKAVSAAATNKESLNTYMNLFYTDVDPAYHSPAGLRAFITSLVMNQVAPTASNTSAAAMQDALYAKHTTQVGSLSFGPYTTRCAAPTMNVNECIVNQGATNLMLWPYASMALGREVGRGPLTSFITPPYYGVDGNGNGFYGVGAGVGQGTSNSDNVILWIILGVIGAMLLLLLLLLLFCCCCGDLGPRKQKDLTVMSISFDGDARYDEVVHGLAAYRRDVRRVADIHHCRKVDETSSGFVIVPDNALKAIRLASELQEQWQPLQASHNDHNRITYHIGIHSGQNDGSIAPVARRTAQLSHGDAVFLTENTHSLLTPVECRDYGVKMKGRYPYTVEKDDQDPEDVEMDVYELAYSDDAAARKISNSPPASPLAVEEEDTSREASHTLAPATEASPTVLMRCEEGERSVDMPAYQPRQQQPLRAVQNEERTQPREYTEVEAFRSFEERPHQRAADPAPLVSEYVDHRRDVEKVREEEEVLPPVEEDRGFSSVQQEVVHQHQPMAQPLQSVESQRHQRAAAAPAPLVSEYVEEHREEEVREEEVPLPVEEDRGFSAVQEEEVLREELPPQQEEVLHEDLPQEEECVEEEVVVHEEPLPVEEEVVEEHHRRHRRHHRHPHHRVEALHSTEEQPHMHRAVAPAAAPRVAERMERREEVEEVREEEEVLPPVEEDRGFSSVQQEEMHQRQPMAQPLQSVNEEPRQRAAAPAPLVSEYVEEHHEEEVREEEVPLPVEEDRGFSAVQEEEVLREELPPQQEEVLHEDLPREQECVEEEVVAHEEPRPVKEVVVVEHHRPKKVLADFPRVEELHSVEERPHVRTEKRPAVEEYVAPQEVVEERSISPVQEAEREEEELMKPPHHEEAPLLEREEAEEPIPVEEPLHNEEDEVVVEEPEHTHPDEEVAPIVNEDEDEAEELVAPPVEEPFREEEEVVAVEEPKHTPPEDVHEAPFTEQEEAPLMDPESPIHFPSIIATRQDDAANDRVVLVEAPHPDHEHRNSEAHSNSAHNNNNPNTSRSMRTLPSHWSSVIDSAVAPSRRHRRSSPPPPPPHFRRDGPTFVGDRMVPCFEVAPHGALYRITDTNTGTWAFYNDTDNYSMHVHFNLGKKSRVAPLGRTEMHEDEESGVLEGDLHVEPGETEMFCEGYVSGHKMRYYAKKLGSHRRS